jgi:hypothetical protein
MKLDLSKVCDVEVDGIDTRDYPDFCNAYISEAWYQDTNGVRELTEEELNYINDECGDFVYKHVERHLY